MAMAMSVAARGWATTAADTLMVEAASTEEAVASMVVAVSMAAVDTAKSNSFFSEKALQSGPFLCLLMGY